MVAIMSVQRASVVSALRRCYDPEIPVNIVDLGLIYDLQVQANAVSVKMTLTAPGCPAHDTIGEYVKQALLKVPGVKAADVQITWEPQWNPTMMSDAARRTLQAGPMMADQAPPPPHITLIQPVIPSKTKPAKRGRLATQPDGSIVLVNSMNQGYQVDQEVVSFWSGCDGSRTVDDLTKEFSAQFNSAPEKVRPALIELTTRLMEAGLLE